MMLTLPWQRGDAKIGHSRLSVDIMWSRDLGCRDELRELDFDAPRWPRYAAAQSTTDGSWR